MGPDPPSTPLPTDGHEPLAGHDNRRWNDGSPNHCPELDAGEDRRAAEDRDAIEHRDAAEGCDPAEAPSGAPATGRRVRLRSAVEVFLCSGFPTQLALSGLLLAGGIYPFDLDGRLSPEYVFTLLLADALLLVGLIVFLLRRRGEDPRQVFFGSRRPRREAALGLALVPAVFLLTLAVLSIIQLIAPALRNIPENPFEALLGSPGNTIVFAGVAVVSGGLREELQRAFILHRFDQHLGGGALGLVIFSAAFGLGHVMQGWDVAITTISLGAFWGVLYLTRRSAIAAIVSHAGFNVIQVLQHSFFGS